MVSAPEPPGRRNPQGRQRVVGGQDGPVFAVVPSGHPENLPFGVERIALVILGQDQIVRVLADLRRDDLPNSCGLLRRRISLGARLCHL